MSAHELKVQPPYFEPLANGQKPFEVRRNDRAYQRGDTLRLREFHAAASAPWKCTLCGKYDDTSLRGHYTGNETTLLVLYVYSGDRVSAGTCCPVTSCSVSAVRHDHPHRQPTTLAHRRRLPRRCRGRCRGGCGVAAEGGVGLVDRTVCNDDSAGIACVLPVHHSGPHAYPFATVVHHTAGKVSTPSEAGEDAAVVNGSYWRGWFAAVTELRRIADEATS